MTKISALALRKKLGSILDEVAEKKKAFIVTRSEKPLVAIIPHEEYDKLRARHGGMRRAAADMDKLRKELSSKFKGIDTTALIREMREQR